MSKDAFTDTPNEEDDEQSVPFQTNNPPPPFAQNSISSSTTDICGDLRDDVLQVAIHTSKTFFQYNASAFMQNSQRLSSISRINENRGRRFQTQMKIANSRPF